MNNSLKTLLTVTLLGILGFGGIALAGQSSPLRSSSEPSVHPAPQSQGISDGDGEADDATEKAEPRQNRTDSKDKEAGESANDDDGGRREDAQ
jgi:hypothetical protein